MGRLRELPSIGQIGRYQVLGKIAKGGMAEIFLARQEGPRNAWRPLVVKRVLSHLTDDADYVESFVHEAELCMRLDHPNICAVYDFGQHGSDYFIAMEYVDGVSLRQLVDRVGPLPVEIAARVIADVASALHHAHTATDDNGKPLGLVHRDVTPENIMIGYDGRVRLLDFGIAKAETQTTKTQAGVLKGKIAHMSPEQYKGEKLDGRADLFSLGATFYEALVGKNPFERVAEAHIVAAILFEENVPDPKEEREEVPAGLSIVVRSMLAKDPEERTESGEAVAEQIETWLRGSGHRVRSADLAAVLETHFAKEKSAGPKLDRTPLEHVVLDPLSSAVQSAELDEFVGATMRAQKRKTRMLIVLTAVVVLSALGYLMFRLATSPAPT